MVFKSFLQIIRIRINSGAGLVLRSRSAPADW